MATRKKPARQTREPREIVVNVRLSQGEQSYLVEGTQRDPRGPMPLAGFLRGAALEHAAKTLGMTFAEFEQKARKKRRG